MPKSLSFQASLLIFAAMILGVLYLAADIIVTNMNWNDFLPRYIGCEALLDSATNPYEEAVSAEIMALNPPGNVEQRFSYPAHLCIMLAPFCILPYTLAVRLWIVLNFLLIGSLIWGYARLFQHRLQGWQLLVQLVVLYLGYRYSMMTIVLGQFTAFVMIAALVAAWAIAQKRTVIAGLALAALTIRPDGAVIALLIGLLALYRRAWRPVGVAAFITVFMLLATTLWAGFWVMDFITDTQDYAQYNTNVLWLPELFAGWGVLIMALALGLGAYIFWQHRDAPERDYYTIVAMIPLLMGLLFIPQTNPYTLVYVLPGAFWLLHRYWNLGIVWAVWIVGIGAIPWLLYAFVPGWAGTEQWVYPLGVLALVAVATSRDSVSHEFGLKMRSGGTEV